MIDTSEVSLNSETQVEASAGSTRITACGRMIRMNTSARLMPSASPAFHCPSRIDTIPARKVSKLKDEMLQVSPTMAVLSCDSWMSK